MPVSKRLYRALVAWREMAASDRPKEVVREYGLCKWYRDFCEGEFFLDLEDELIKDFGNCAYPFDVNYLLHDADGAKHLNPLRRAWVDAKIREYENAGI